MATTLNTKIQLRHDITANWAANNTVVLAEGEIGIELLTDSSGNLTGKSKMKIGDGQSKWSELPYFGGEGTKTQIFENSIIKGGVKIGERSKSDGTSATGIWAVIESKGVEPNQGDVAIIKEAIPEDVTLNDLASCTQFQYTAYIYDGTNWKAMDGNYDASNVYFGKNILVTQSVGNVSASEANPKDLEFKNKSLEEIWQYLYAKEDKNISVTQPSFSLNTTSVSGEVGTTYNDPTITMSFSGGSYEHGSKDANGIFYTKNDGTGVLWNNDAEIYYFPSNTSTTAETLIKRETTASISNNKLEKAFDVNSSVASTSNKFSDTEFSQTFYCRGSCGASTRKPVTNFKKWLVTNQGAYADSYESAWGNTVAQDLADDNAKVTANATSTTNKKPVASCTFKATGWRGWFSGALTTPLITSSDATNITSDSIRALSGAVNGGFFNNSSGSVSPNISVGVTQLVFAAPKGKINYTLGLDGETLASGIVVNSTNPPSPWTVKKLKNAVQVNAIDGGSAIDYDIFYANGNNTTAQPFNITYTKK